MYKEITVAQTILDNPETIAKEIDRVLLKCLHQKAPVYIGIPSDIVNLTISVPKAPLKTPLIEISHKPSLKDAIAEITEMIQKASFPLLIPGLQINRRSLAKEFLQLAETFRLPFCSMPMNKAIIDEDHDLFLGLSCGGICRDALKQQMEKVDCLLIFGEVLSDFNTGGFSSSFYRHSTIQVSYDQVTVKRHTFHNVFIQDVLTGLTESLKNLKYITFLLQFLLSHSFLVIVIKIPLHGFQGVKRVFTSKILIMFLNHNNHYLCLGSFNAYLNLSSLIQLF
jgi:TPP-dependent 2-oxoacid decarboxylase